ncbi:TPA: tetratricopeptide repeat protein, partial [Klebsiella pneumoniae]|nr:tetratricopeptide repeat protein [Klebsiella pneumoniae]
METFNNENDQVDALKRFFAENGKALAVGVILGIGALVGWRYWTSHQQDTARDASLAYEKATSALKSNTPEVLSGAEKFAADNKNTYGAFAS